MNVEKFELIRVLKNGSRIFKIQKCSHLNCNNNVYKKKHYCRKHFFIKKYPFNMDYILAKVPQKKNKN